MDQLLKTISDLHLTHIYVHADEDIYMNIVQLKWKYKDLYRNIVPLIGGFHKLRVFQRLICKRFSCLGLQQLFLDAKAMPSGVVHKGFSAYHYYFCMDVVKVAFCAILQIRMETLTSSYSKLSPELLHSMRKKIYLIRTCQLYLNPNISITSYLWWKTTKVIKARWCGHFLKMCLLFLPWFQLSVRIAIRDI